MGKGNNLARIYHQSLEENEAYCVVCKDVKDKKEFFRDRSRSSGVSSRCKECEKERYKTRSPYFKDYFKKKKDEQVSITEVKQ